MPTDDSLRKAAVLVSCLGEADARRVLNLLGTGNADRIRQVIGGLGTVSADEQQGVMGEFIRRLAPGSPDHRFRGVELDDDLARRLEGVHERGASDRTAAGTTEDAAAPFAFLLETEPDVVAPFLARENPQTVALVLSYLQRRQAAELLSRLEQGFQALVLKRLAKLEEVDSACIEVVAGELRSWIARQREKPRPRVSKDAIIQEMLEKLAPAEPMADARPEEPRAHLAFEDLGELDDDVLVRVFWATPRELLILALAGADEAFVSRITHKLHRRDVKRIRRSIHELGPTRLDDIEAAKQEVARIAAHVLAVK
jgi:flagellar motor switch protein FliG